jgi:hypothetical protein
MENSKKLFFDRKQWVKKVDHNQEYSNDEDETY